MRNHKFLSTPNILLPFAVCLLLMHPFSIHAAVITEFNYALASLSETELLADWTSQGAGSRAGVAITSNSGSTFTYTRNDIPIGGGQAWMFEAVMSADQISGAGARGARMWTRFIDPGAPAFPSGDKLRHVELRLIENAAMERRFALFDALGGGEKLSITANWAVPSNPYRVRLRRQLVGADDLIFLEAQLANALPGSTWISESTSVSGLSFQDASAVPTPNEFGFGNHSTPSGDFDSLWPTIRLMASNEADTLLPAVVPVPASVWLFGSGLFGLIGIARRKKAA